MNIASVFLVTIQSYSFVAGELLKCTATGFANQFFDKIRTHQNYGFQSFPKSTAKGIILKKGNTTVIFGIDDPTLKLNGEEGDVIMLSALDNYIKALAAGGFTIESKKEFLLNSDSIKLGGVDDLVKLVTEKVLSTISGHTHPLDIQTLMALKSINPAMVALDIDPSNKTSVLEAK